MVQGTLFVGLEGLAVCCSPKSVARPVGRINSRALPFPYLFGIELAWFHSVGGTHIEDTGANLVESVRNAGNAAC